MKFKLVYDGPLPPQERAGADVKQSIRAHLHPQLRRLWHEHPALKRYTPDSPVSLDADQVGLIADNYVCGPYKFVPLLRLRNGLACRLDLQVLLRSEPHHQIFAGNQRGDLDNRLKTLIDGLRMPRQPNQMGNLLPNSDQQPMYCLMEDDQSVFELSVKTDRLLADPHPGQVHRDVLAIIGVHITTTEGHELAFFSHGFGYVAG